jgi:hypothetical protein
MGNLIFFGGDLYRQALIFIIIIVMMVVVPSMPTVLVAIVIGLVVITAIVAWIHRIVTVLIVPRFYIDTNVSFRFGRDQSDQSCGR